MKKQHTLRKIGVFCLLLAVRGLSLSAEPGESPPLKIKKPELETLGFTGSFPLGKGILGSLEAILRPGPGKKNIIGTGDMEFRSSFESIDGMALTRFTLLVPARLRGKILVQWDVPRDRKYDWLSQKSLKDMVGIFAYSSRSGHELPAYRRMPRLDTYRITDVSYRQDELGDAFSGFTMEARPGLAESRRFWLTMGEVLALNAAGEAAYYMDIKSNRDDWEYPLTWNGFKQKVSDGWKFDNNNFSTNCIGHIYSGNFYFNAARTNGYSFLESVVFAVGGSLFWEYAGEIREQVSLNDLVFTGIGGSLFGEALYQSALFVEHSFRKGLIRDVVVFLLDPMLVINRELNRQHFGSYRVSVRLLSPAQLSAEKILRK